MEIKSESSCRRWNYPRYPLCKANPAQTGHCLHSVWKNTLCFYCFSVVLIDIFGKQGVVCVHPFCTYPEIIWKLNTSFMVFFSSVVLIVQKPWYIQCGMSDSGPAPYSSFTAQSSVFTTLTQLTQRHQLINKPFRRLKCVCQHKETLKSALKQGQHCRTLLYVIVLDCYLLKWVLIRHFYSGGFFLLGIWLWNSFEMMYPVAAILFMKLNLQMLNVQHSQTGQKHELWMCLLLWIPDWTELFL